MSLRAIRLGVSIVTVIGLLAPLPASSQSASTASATRVRAELTRGSLNPEDSQPGDEVVLKIRDDVRANGQIVFEKGSEVTGIVRHVRQLEADAGANVKSLMQIEWLAPELEGGASQQLNLAVEAISFVHPMRRAEGPDVAGPPAIPPAAGARSRAGGGLVGGALGTVAGVAGGVAGATRATVGGAGGGILDSSAAASGRSNLALMTLPSIVAVDAETTGALHNDLGLESDGQQLFRTGSGEVISAGGSRHSLDIYSHMANDTVITSPSRDFEISSGAELQVLVGIQNF